MRADGNDLQVWEPLGESCGTAVGGWVRLWNHWGCSALNSRHAWKKTDSSFPSCCEKVDYEPWLVKLWAWMPGQREILIDKLDLDYWAVSVQFDGVGLFNHHENWGSNSEFEMRKCTKRGLAVTFFGWRNVNLFAVCLGFVQNYFCPGLNGRLTRKEDAYSWFGHIQSLSVTLHCSWAAMRLAKRICGKLRLQIWWYLHCNPSLKLPVILFSFWGMPIGAHSRRAPLCRW